jgi:hypothetical protein
MFAVEILSAIGKFVAQGAAAPHAQAVKFAEVFYFYDCFAHV